MTEKYYENDKEIDVQETRRLIGPNSYDDNFNLRGYTSELRYNNDDGFFAFVDFNADGEGKIEECPHCLEYGFHNKLGAKILKHGEKPAPDHDQWCSCYECGNTFPLHQTFADSEIKDSLETVNNPFESNESIFLSTDSRATQRRKRENRNKYKKGVTRHTSKRFKTEEHEDPEIQAVIDKGLAVNILYDSSY